MTKEVLLYFALLLWFVVPIVAQPTIFVEDKNILPQESFYVDVKVNEFPVLSGMQFSVNWENSILSFDSVEIENVTALPSYSIGSFNITNTNNGFLATAWTDPAATGIAVEDGTTFFRIHFTHIGQIGDSTQISITDMPLAKEFISEDAGMQIFEPTVENGTIIVLNPTSTTNPLGIPNQLFKLGQNEPNPFSLHTKIPVEVFESTELTLEIYDTKGIIVYTEWSIYPPGVHTIGLAAEKFPAAGVYYYKLKSKDFFITNRMILVR